MYCLESKISKQVLLTRKPYCVPRIDDADLIRKLNAVNKSKFAAELGKIFHDMCPTIDWDSLASY